MHIDKVESFETPAIFRCIGDLTIESRYSPDTIVFGVRRFVDALLFYYAVFENWADVKRYVQYDHIVGENRRREICLFIFETPYEDETLNSEVREQNSCNDFYSIQESLKD